MKTLALITLIAAATISSGHCKSGGWIRDLLENTNIIIQANPQPVYYNQPVYREYYSQPVYSQPVYYTQPVYYSQPVYREPVRYCQPVYYSQPVYTHGGCGNKHKHH